MPEAKTRLHVRRVNRVGFVDKGDDPKADIVFFKRHEIEKKIIERDGKFLVVSEDETKVLGTHDTRGQAEAQLAAVDKRAETFGEVGSRDMIRDEIWDVTHRLSQSMMSIVNDADTGQDQVELLNTSLDQFTSVVRGRASMWLAGKPVEKKEPGKMKKLLKMLAQKAGMADDEVDKLLDDDTDTGGDMPFDIEKLDEETRAEFEKLQDQLAAATEKLEADGSDDGDNEVLKGLTPDVRKLFDDERKAREDSDAKLQKLIDDGENNRFIAKSAELGLPADDFAGTLRKAHDALGDEDFDKLADRFKALNAQVKEAGLYDKIGVDGEGEPTSAGAEVNELAKEVAKTDGISLEHARGKVMKSRPDLRNALESEEKSRTAHLHSED